VKLRDRVLEEVTRVYFDRRELQVAMLLEPASTLEAAWRRSSSSRSSRRVSTR
jgi:hypothetical protein